MTTEVARDIGELLAAQLDVIDPGPVDVTVSGVYTDLPEDVYHADPVPGGSLSHSGAKALLPPSCPAIFAYQREHGRPDTRAFDYGHAAHNRVLGVGSDIVAVDAPDWRTKKAQEQAAGIRGQGGVPLLAREAAQVEQMAAALRADPLAARLLQPGAGTPETSLFWTHDQTDTWLRARLDWLPFPTNGRMIVPDYKSAVTANPAEFGKSAANFGYHIQSVWYTAGVRALGLADDVAFVFVIQQKTPPYLVSVVELDAEADRIGETQMRRAVDTYRRCADTDTWPGYAAGVELVGLPYWFTKTFNEENK